ARTVARRGIRNDVGGGKAIETLHQVGPDHTFHIDQGIERHQGAAARAHVDLAEVFRPAAKFRLGLQVDAEVAAKQGKVVDVQAAEGALHGGEDVAKRHVERGGLFAV